MFITTLVFAAMIQSPTATVDTTRVAFTKCLNTHMKKSLGDKKSPTEFEMGLKSICTAERDAFRAAVVASNRAGGDSQADAADNADMQVEDYHANFTAKYTDYSESGTMPG
jgi:hypothetical protein